VDALDHLLVLTASLAAGAVNAVAGGGSLLTFPTLLAVGIDPVPASITNTLGLMPGYLGGTHAYRAEVAEQRHRVRILVVPAGLGAVAGALLLLLAPEAVFETVVPYLVLLAAVMLALQPRLARWIAGRPARARELPPLLLVVTFLGGLYGAYFGGALGVILLAALGTVLADDLQRVNALKSVLSVVINGVAVAIFVFSPHVHWTTVVVMGVGSLIGGRVGAGYARRLGVAQLRRVVVTVATVAAVVMFARG
jgi:uncharacterized membrane protein YfcA